jgi:E3 ubiquitin-protein ligase RAD18
MMTEGKLRKKLQEIGIPNWGNKDLMKRRHIEWLNIHNSNCDADESVRKTRRQLVRELEEWENTQGGRADTKESKVMRKDFDGNGYAKFHKSDFDDLIAQARKKRAVRNSDDKEATNGGADGPTQQEPQSHPGSVVEMPDAPSGTEQHSEQSIQENGVELQGLGKSHGTHLGAQQDGAQSTDDAGLNLAPKPADSTTAPVEEPRIGLQNPLGSPSRKLPLFALPEEPVKEVDIPAR